MSHSGGRNVPKFGSFKPRAPINEPTSKARRETAKAYKTRNNDLQRNRHSERQLSGNDRVKERQGRRHHLSHNESPQKSPPEPQKPESWIMDIRGDAKNVQFGSLHRNSVPQYHRAGQGSVIGLPPNIKIDRKQSTETGIVFEVTRTTVNSQTALHLRSLSFAETEMETLDDEFLELDERRKIEDETKAVAVGVGIWKFIEADEDQDHKGD